ncbi:MAG: methylated-DNA--[protein]-cysteine S-methyltransferase [Candidatus Accumulibacter similis]|jgi:methylated-DNA-[protein]-cysteine S-methyltransferase|nr:MAG: methylated-DNA--[protein]-cysteine S-methyltransferase [Candidatus Accumulibacter similis]
MPAAVPAADPSPWQAVIAAQGFRLGVRCDDAALQGIVFLPPGPAQAPANALAAEAARQLAAYLADAEYVFALPLQPTGTPFQRRVWQQIAAIPVHQTRSYGDIARELRSAARAVGQACGRNPYPVVVPCHRVLAAAGGLGGFVRQRDGYLLDVKRWLLAHEAR